MEDLADVLLNFRAKENLTQVQLAKLLGVSNKTISTIEQRNEVLDITKAKILVKLKQLEKKENI